MENNKKCVKINDFSHYFKHIVGYTEQVKMLENFAKVLANHKEIKDRGGNFPRGLILKGSNGVGKTIMARALIKASGLPCFDVKLGISGDKFDDTLGDIIEEARKASPSILFIDELDKMVGQDAHGFIENDYRFEVFLKYISELENSEVFVLGTMNTTRKLDVSLIRSGRIDKTIEIDVPSESDKKSIFTYYLRKVKKEKIDIDELSQSFPGCSCADIKAVVNDAVIKAFADGKEKITNSDLQKAIEEKTCSSLEQDNGLDNNGKAVCSIHEAGHVVATLFSPVKNVVKASILGRGATGGSVRLRSNGAKNCTLNENLAYIDIGMASEMAVNEMLGTKYDGCGRDHYQALEEAKLLITRSGYLGNHYLLGDIEFEGCPMASSKYIQEIEEKTHQMVTDSVNYLRDLMSLARPLLVTISRELFNKKTLESKEIIDLFDSYLASIKGSKTEELIDELITQRYGEIKNPYDVLFNCQSDSDCSSPSDFADPKNELNKTPISKA